MAGIKGFAKYLAMCLFTAYGWIRIKLIRSPTLLILTYHRVLPTRHPERALEQPGMIISPELLQRHIDFIRRLGAVPIHLDDWIERKKNAPDDLPALSVAFTFDDGWRDNYLYAYPVLKKERIPATIFLVTGMLDTTDIFWPERVLRLLLTSGTDLSAPGLQWLEPYLDKSCIRAQGEGLSLNQADGIINRLKSLDDASIIRFLENTEKQPSQHALAAPEPSILSTAELAEMNRDAIIKYGAHTRHHYRLNRVESEEVLNNQIVGCLEDLQKLPVESVPIFCYPNGNISATGEKLVAEHYAGACTTKTGWNRLDQCVYQLNRFNLHDGNSATERSLLATIGRGLFPIRT